MRVFAALLWREIYERRLLFLAGGLLGLVPVIVPYLPGGPERYTPEDLRTVAVVVLVTLFGGATLLILGSTIVGRDVSEGRLGFYFSRPIPSRMLWASRVLAAVLLVCATLLLLMTPTVVIDYEIWAEQFTNRSGERAWPVLGRGQVFTLKIANSLPDMPSFPIRLGLHLLVLVTLLVIAHAVSSIVRSRSSWMLVDLAGLGVVLAVGSAARNIFVREEALAALVWMEWILLLWLLGTLLVAGAVQLQRGRTDSGLGHRWLSAVLWPLLLLGAAGFYAYAQFIAAGRIDDLEELAFTQPSPNEQWLVAGGPMRHRVRSEAAFLLDTRHGTSWRLGSLGVVRPWVTFAADSSRVVWLRCESRVPLDCEIWSKDLRQPTQAPQRTKVPSDRLPDRIALSADGSRIVLAEAQRVAVHDLDSGRQLAVVAASQPTHVVFLSPERVRFQESFEDSASGRTIRVRQFDIHDLQVVETGRLPIGYRGVLDPRADRLLYLRGSRAGFGLFDSATGDQLLELDKAWRKFPSHGFALASGRLVLVFRDPFRSTLLVVSPEGQVEHRIPHPLVREVRFGGETSPGRLWIAFDEGDRGPVPASRWPGVPTLRGWTTYELDVRHGVLQPFAVGGAPLGIPHSALSERLFLAGGKSVVRWNRLTDAYEVLIEPSDASSFRRGSIWEGAMPWRSLPPYDQGS
ncbi:MAG: hypothetical protein AAF657_05265 [Acidobacteriota bacterium]